MAEQALLDRLKRYSKKCLTERTDGDFADAVWEAVEVIDGLLNDLQEALDRIAELTDTNVGKWIPVAERLPKAEYGESEDVLTIDSLKVMRVAYFDGGNWCYPTGEVISTTCKFHITHWMPLPESPKEEKDG